VTRYLYSHPEQFHVRLVPGPIELDREDLRLTVDLEEDLEHAQAIYEALGPEVDWQGIAEMLDGQPMLRSRMAQLNRRYAKV
jgi:spore coat polysaccharide biosynthesis protein SpsF (cytidylyltransferase family)